MRPEFLIPLHGIDGAAVLAEVAARIGRGDTGFHGSVHGHHANLRLPRAQRTLLSPYLNLELREGDGQPALHGRFSPHPHVWTGFMALYGTLAMLGLTATMYGFAELTLGEGSWLLLGAPVAALLIAFVYGAAVIGQGLTVDTMYRMRALVDAAVQTVASVPAGREPKPHDA
jgi:hypothetical protein